MIPNNLRGRIFEDEVLLLVQRKNLTTAIWTEAPTLVQMEIIDRHSTALRKLGCHWFFVNIIVGGTPIVAKEVRSRAKDMAVDAAEHTLASSHIILAEGLAGVVARTILSGAVMFGAQSFPVKVFKSLSDAALWLGTHCCDSFLWRDGEIEGHWAQLIPEEAALKSA